MRSSVALMLAVFGLSSSSVSASPQEGPLLERPGLDIGLLLGWQTFKQSQLQSTLGPYDFSGVMWGLELRYRLKNGLGLGATVTYAKACYPNAGSVDLCVAQVPVVLEVSWGPTFRWLQPWVGIGAGLGFIQWENSAYDVEDRGYAGTGLDVLFLRIRAGVDVVIPVGSLGLSAGVFGSIALATAPLPVPAGLGSYVAHQTYSVGFRLLLMLPTGPG